VTIPIDLVENPDNGCPSLKNGILTKSVTSGLVKRNTTIRSIIVVSPRVNAKPLTPPTAKM
jgi:hypothetical protein